MFILKEIRTIGNATKEWSHKFRNETQLFKRIKALPFSAKSIYDFKKLHKLEMTSGHVKIILSIEAETE